jgi:hypothetical protein
VCLGRPPLADHDSLTAPEQWLAEESYPERGTAEEHDLPQFADVPAVAVGLASG